MIAKLDDDDNRNAEVERSTSFFSPRTAVERSGSNTQKRKLFREAEAIHISGSKAEKRKQSTEESITEKRNQMQRSRSIAEKG